MAEAAAMPSEQQLIKAQAIIRGHLSRSGSIGARIRSGKEQRAAASAAGELGPQTPFMPTPHGVVDELLVAAGVNASSVVLDIGVGDARVLIAAARQYGARGIGVESLPLVYEKAVAARDEAGFDAEQVELHCTDFTEPGNVVMERCLDRANVVFVFLLPAVMPLILTLLLQSIRRRQERAVAARAAALAAGVAEPASDSRSSSCPCDPSVPIRVASWTFSFASKDPLLALPLQPSRSVSLQSAHTKLYLYDLCACMLNHHEHASNSGHAAHISRAFVPWAEPRSVASASAQNESFSSESALSAVDASCVPWGHALNTSALLRRRWNSTKDTGLFIEADLRIRPSALADIGASEWTFDIDDVVLAHDAVDPGEPFLAWYASLQDLLAARASAASSSADAPVPPWGLKLDFKSLAAVEPVLLFLASERHGGPLRIGDQFVWLNADILPGPGFDTNAAATVDADKFLELCTRLWPEAVLSLGWTTRAPSADAAVDSTFYSHAHVDAMLALLSRYPSAHQCTFPVRASLVRASWERGTLQRLLAACPNSTLTVWTSWAEQALPDAPQVEAWIKEHLPRDRTFIDLALDG